MKLGFSDSKHYASCSLKYMTALWKAVYLLHIHNGGDPPVATFSTLKLGFQLKHRKYQFILIGSFFLSTGFGL